MSPSTRAGPPSAGSECHDNDDCAGRTLARSRRDRIASAELAWRSDQSGATFCFYCFEPAKAAPRLENVKGSNRNATRWRPAGTTTARNNRRGPQHRCRLAVDLGDPAGIIQVMQHQQAIRRRCRDKLDAVGTERFNFDDGGICPTAAARSIGHIDVDVSMVERSPEEFCIALAASASDHR